MTSVEQGQHIATIHDDTPPPESPSAVDSTHRPTPRGWLSGLAWQRWLADNLFPRTLTPPATDRRTVLGYVAAFLLAVTYQLVIPQGRTHLTHMWAEDGRIFFDGAVAKSFPLVLVEPYGGYLHVLPRLSTELATHLPIGWWAAVVAIAAAVVRAAVALLVFTAASGHLPSRRLRAVLAAAVVLLPAGNSEALNNLANLHWFVIFGAFWALLWRPTTRWQNGLSAVALLLAALTSPLGMLLVPLAAARLALPRRRDRVPAFAFIIGSAMQIVPLLGSTSERGGEPFDLLQGVSAAAARGPLVLFFGPEWTAELYPHALAFYSDFYAWPAALAAVIVLAIVGYGLRNGTSGRRILVITSLLLSAAFISAELYMNWSFLLRLDAPNVVIPMQRYSAAPCLFLFTAVLVSLARAPRPQLRHLLTVVRVGVAAIILVGIGYQWQSTTGLVRLDGPTWQQSLAVAEQQCAAGATEVRVDINPAWFVPLTCEYLTKAR
ncbi:hypothetical protein [Micromonospora sp. NPDC085948]|uniref:hypothetical protein n=1 Tax=Micromonospora sp. NPDC085948 TaxID=3155293 RepID=UPI00343E8B0A